jgi:hypothetical protein
MERFRTPREIKAQFIAACREAGHKPKYYRDNPKYMCVKCRAKCEDVTTREAAAKLEAENATTIDRQYNNHMHGACQPGTFTHFFFTHEALILKLIRDRYSAAAIAKKLYEKTGRKVHTQTLQNWLHDQRINHVEILGYQVTRQPVGPDGRYRAKRLY